MATMALLATSPLGVRVHTHLLYGTSGAALQLADAA
jgi:hypothetical protein